MYTNYFTSTNIHHDVRLWLNIVEDEQEKVLTVKEFAARVKVHPNTIRRAIKNGRIAAFRIGGGPRSALRIPESEIKRIAFLDLEEYIEKLIDKRNTVIHDH